MLSGIANLIFGATPAEEETVANEELDLKITQVENEWTLVDKKQCCENSGECTEMLASHGRPKPPSSSSSSSCSPRHNSSYNTPSHSSNNSHSNSDDSMRMEDSWLITPPPCFTAGGPSPQRLETNPMENLLIEHPSMSVYDTRGRPSSTGVESVQSESSNIEDVNRNVVQPRSPRRPRAVAARAGLLARVEMVKPMQRREKKISHKNLSQGRLRRANKARECLGLHHRRRNHLQQPRAVAKRKC